MTPYGLLTIHGDITMSQKYQKIFYAWWDSAQMRTLRRCCKFCAPDMDDVDCPTLLCSNADIHAVKKF